MADVMETIPYNCRYDWDQMTDYCWYCRFCSGYRYWYFKPWMKVSIILFL